MLLLFTKTCDWVAGVQKTSPRPHVRMQSYMRTATTSVTLLVREYLNHNTPLQYDCTTKVILHILGQILETIHLENLQKTYD